MKASRKNEAAVILLLLLLPLLWFAPQALGGKTLLPADNLFAFEPWRSFAEQQGVARPYNSLISDLILENYAWKSFILEALRAGDLAGVLWSPRLFAGMPFLAAGQHSGLYPLSILFYILPLWRAYGVFTWLQLGLAAVNMYVFARVLGLRRPAAIFSAIAFAFSGFFIVSVNFTMIIAAAAWLPLILALIEVVVQKQARAGRGPYSPVPYIATGALALGISILAGHVEITYYTLLVSGFYAAWRLIGLWRQVGDWRPALRLGLWLLLMVMLGLGLGAVQFIPLYELVTQSFREGSASLQQVREWAWPSRQIITFLLPDAFGNPTHHSYFDIWERAWKPVTQNALGQPLQRIDWGVKNYVEGGNYLGLLTLLLAVVAVMTSLSRNRAFRRFVKSTTQPAEASIPEQPNHRGAITLFAVLAVLSLLFAFGTPLYAILYYGLPGYSQLHSAFRWVFPYTLSMAVLAGYGLNILLAHGRWPMAEHAVRNTQHAVRSTQYAIRSTQYPVRILAWSSLLAGISAVAAVLISMAVPGPFVALGERLLASSDLARQFGYADGAMAWSHQAWGLARFGLMALLAGGALLLGTRGFGDAGTRGRGGMETRRHGDTGTRGYGDTGTRGRGDSGTRGHGDSETRGRRDAETRGRRDAGTRGHGDTETRGRGDTGTQGRGDAGIWRHGDTGTRGYGDTGTRGRGDSGTRRHGDSETRGRGDLPLSPSPRLRVSPSPRLRVSPSPRLRVSPSPRLPLSPSPRLRVSPSPRLHVSPSPRLPLSASLLALLVLDLWLFGHGFNPATDPKLLEFKPPVIEFLQSRQDPEQPWRLTSFDAPGEKVLNANSAMPYGLEDVRGYDSIIPKQYVAYMERIQRQDDLLYNRIAPIYTQMDGQANYDALDSPLLNLLGVRYVVTTHTIPNPGYKLVYDAEVKVYENRKALPRAFIVPEAVAAADQDQALDLLERLDPAQVVVIEGITADELLPPASPQLREARISQRRNREVFVDVNISDRGWLVLTDNHFEGWKAYLRPFGVEGEGITAEGESIEQQLTLYRADGTFRAVYLPQAGQWTVRFVYSPRSFLLGLYATFLASVTLLLLAGWWAWGRYYRDARSEVGTVAKNSAVQVVMSLLNKAIDFAFAMLRLRVLSPVGEGSYVFAIAFYGIFEILTRFGLGTLVTRDVAIDRARARSYLANTFVLRIGLWVLSLPAMAVVALFYRVALNQLTAEEAQAIALFALALLFANFSDAITAIFNAYEKMEYPAGIATVIATAKVALGALVLLPPFNLGFVGLAGVSLMMNVVQMIWLGFVMEKQIFGTRFSFRDTRFLREAWFPKHRLDLDLQRYMLRESGPLMINNLLATVFWRVSQFVLRGATNPAALGIFSAGVKWLDGLNVIPAYFTLAIFPLMSRYAHNGKDTLARSYRLAVQILFMIALPVAVFFTFTATPLIRILGGAAYLPDSAIALRIMIWSIPIGFINSVTQYVLIAVNQQRFLTKAFIIGVAFTALANLAFVPRFGYLAAAIILIPAELSLFIPFLIAVHRHVAVIPWPRLLGRPLLAAGLNAAATWGALEAGAALPLALTGGFAVYLVGLLLAGTARDEEFAVLRNLLRRR